MRKQTSKESFWEKEAWRFWGSWLAKASEVDRLKRGIRAVRSLMDESDGVAGLHLNGDIATWDELEKGGKFEEWLAAFNLAEYSPQQPTENGE